MTLRVLVITHANKEDNEISDPGIMDQIVELQKMGATVDTWKVNIGQKCSYLKTGIRTFLLNFQKKRYDVVHAFYSLNGMLARGQFLSPLVVTLMGTDLLSKEHFYQQGGRDTLIGKIIIKVADEIIVQSEEMARVVPPSEKVAHIIPMGINTDIFTLIPKDEARRRLNLPPDQKLILFPWHPARKEKQFPLLEKAVARLSPSYNARIMAIYGRPRQELADYMNACDVLVLASDYEGSPVAVREALACNLPVVSVPAGDVPSLLAKIEGCYLCNRDAEDMAEKITRVLEKGERVNSRPLIIPLNTVTSAAEVFKIYQSLNKQ
ncbi:MAG: glycosyltransferase family 4 protein [Leptolinea sp.]|nr:glycosyltransferase family 4 protein [Leptolinea sp.]